MKKFFTATFTVLWVLLYGLWASITSAILGIALCLSLVGIPFGIQCFRMIPVLFNPCGKDVRNDYVSHVWLNSIWLFAIGLPFWLVHAVVAVLCYVSIIFIPVGIQLGKIRRFYFAPFGAEIVPIDND